MTYDVIDYIQGRAPRGAAVKCPFHDDQTASAVVMADTGRLWCFRCQLGADQAEAAIKLWFEDLDRWRAHAMAEALIKQNHWPIVTQIHPAPPPPAQEDPRLPEVMTAWCRAACANLAHQPGLIARLGHERAVRHPLRLGIGVASLPLFQAFLTELEPRLRDERLLVASGLIYDDAPETPWERRYRLGERWVLPEVRGHRVIHFQARAQERDARVRYLNPKGVPRPIYGWESLARPRPHLWMVEGVFDLYPLLEAGEAAISVNGLGFDPRQLDGFKELAGQRRILIAFDNDPPHPETGERPGLTAAVKREELLVAEGLRPSRWLPPDPYKDIGEWIVARGVEHLIAIAEWEGT